MHVLQLLPSLEVGGVERGVLDLSKGLIARGHRVSVVSSGGRLVERLVTLGAVHHRLPVHEKSPATMWSCIPAVTQIMTTTGVDLVHARSRVPAWIGWAAARRAQRPFVTTAHGFYRPHLASCVMGWGRSVIAPSEALGRYVVDELHVLPERLRIIPRGVDLGEFRFQPPAPHHQGPWRIGLFGRLSVIKGHDIALRACERLIRQGHAVTLCIAGDTVGSPLRASLEPLINTLRLQEAVEWLGLRDDMPALMSSMDLVVVPSVYPESFGRVVIEAQAVGRPVVASQIGALADLDEDGRNGLLVRPGDAEGLAQAIERFITDSSLRLRCIEAGRKRVESDWGLDRMVERTLEVYEECVTKPRVLIWKLSALGDVVLATPSLRAIRRQFPQGYLTLVVGRAAYEVVARCPYLHDIIVYDPRRKDRGPWRHWALIRRLRRGAFDLSIDLQNSRKTHLLAWLAGIPVRVGYRRKYGWLLNRGVRLPKVVLTPIAHQQYLLRYALAPNPLVWGHAGLSPDGEQLELWPSPLDEQRVERLLAAGGVGRAGAAQPLVGLHPGGSGRWKTKRWDLDRWARLCDALMQRNIRVVITGGPDEQALGEALLQLTTAKPLVLIGQTNLMELACLIRRCDAFVAHDSSSLHVAAAMGTPTIALFGPTDPQRHLPPNFSGQVIKKDVFCSPCYSTYCRTITHACMKRISLEEVLAAVRGLLAETDIAVLPR